MNCFAANTLSEDVKAEVYPYLGSKSKSEVLKYIVLKFLLEISLSIDEKPLDMTRAISRICWRTQMKVHNTISSVRHVAPFVFDLQQIQNNMIQFTVLAMWFDASYLRIYATLDFVTLKWQ